MAYELTILETEVEYRTLFANEYCNPYKPILTPDEIWVRFFPEMFDHAFFESLSRRDADKALFSIIRAQRIMWIRETLQDPDAILKVGWNKKLKSYDDCRRVAIVKGNYVVIIAMINDDKAKFITAYVADDETIETILTGPDWT